MESTCEPIREFEARSCGKQGTVPTIARDPS